MRKVDCRSLGTNAGVNKFLALINYAPFKSRRPKIFAIMCVKMLFQDEKLRKGKGIDIGYIDNVIKVIYASSQKKTITNW